MRLDRPDGDVQSRGNDLVARALTNKAHDFKFALGQDRPKNTVHDTAAHRLAHVAGAPVKITDRGTEGAEVCARRCVQGRGGSQGRQAQSGQGRRC